MLTLDEGTKAYVAGIIDMVGLIRLRPMKNGNPPIPYVGVSTNNKQVVDFLAGLTDTKVTVTHRKYGRHRCTQHCPTPCSDVDSTSYRWSVTGAKATVLLANIKRYLMFKTTVANEALEAAREANYKAATMRKMTVLGWDLPNLRPAENKNEER